MFHEPVYEGIQQVGVARGKDDQDCQANDEYGVAEVLILSLSLLMAFPCREKCYESRLKGNFPL